MQNVQIDAKPYTVWSLTSNGWFVVSSYYNSVNQYPTKIISNIQLRDDDKPESLKLIISRNKYDIK